MCVYCGEIRPEQELESNENSRFGRCESRCANKTESALRKKDYE